MSRSYARLVRGKTGRHIELEEDGVGDESRREELRLESHIVCSFLGHMVPLGF